MHTDLYICLSYSKLLSEKDLSKFKNVLVVHESELPKGKGWSPLSWQILEGKVNLHSHCLKRQKKLMMEKYTYKKK